VCRLCQGLVKSVPKFGEVGSWILVVLVLQTSRGFEVEHNTWELRDMPADRIHVRYFDCRDRRGNEVCECVPQTKSVSLLSIM
jgi:hypothetical protein